MDEQQIKEAVLSIWKEQGRQSRLPVNGRSMEPLLRVGDEIEVEHAHAPIRFGDLILFERGGGWVAHRVIGRCDRDANTFILEKGDAVPNATLIPIVSIQGRVVGRWRNQQVIRLDTTLSRIGGWIMACLSRAHWEVEKRWPQARRPLWMHRLTGTVRSFWAKTCAKGGG